MTQILLSVKPKYAEMILNGTKTIEFRRKIWKDRSVDTVLLYASSPVCKVLGEFVIGSIWHFDALRLWEVCGESEVKTGVSFEYFLEYFRGQGDGYGIQTDIVKRYSTPKTLAEFGIDRAPQNFCYLPHVKQGR